MPEDPQDHEMDDIEELDEGGGDAPAPRRAGRRTAGRAAARSGGRAPSRRAGRAAAAASGRPAGAGRRRVEAPAKAGPNPMLFVGIGVVVVAAAAFFFLKGSGGDDGGGGEEGTMVASAGGAGASAAPTKSPKEVYAERMAALGDDDVLGRIELASFCDEQSWGGSATKLRREALLIDPDHPDARRALGFTRYEGPATKFRGRWLSDADLARVKELEKFATGDVGAAATSLDVFLREAEQKKRSLAREFPESNWTYAVGPGTMKRPFLVLIEHGRDADVDAYRKEYDELLTTLYDAFFDRYRDLFDMEEIESPAVVIIWDTVETYTRHIEKHPEGRYSPAAGGLRGYYQPWSQHLILWRGGGLRNVLLHEGAHMLIHYAFAGRGFRPSSQSPWFQEGFAEFFGGNKVEVVGGKKTYVLGQRIPGRERELQMLQNFGKRLSVFDLVKLSSYEFENAKNATTDPTKTPEEIADAQFVVVNVYAQGWALIMYLNHADGGKYRPAFDAYFKAETQGGGHWETMGELLALEDEKDWEEFDKRFLTWVQTTLRKL